MESNILPNAALKRDLAFAGPQSRSPSLPQSAAPRGLQSPPFRLPSNEHSVSGMLSFLLQTLCSLRSSNHSPQTSSRWVGDNARQWRREMRCFERTLRTAEWRRGSLSFRLPTELLGRLGGGRVFHWELKGTNNGSDSRAVLRNRWTLQRRNDCKLCADSPAPGWRRNRLRSQQRGTQTEFLWGTLRCARHSTTLGMLRVLCKGRRKATQSNEIPVTGFQRAAAPSLRSAAKPLTQRAIELRCRRAMAQLTAVGGRSAVRSLQLPVSVGGKATALKVPAFSGAAASLVTLRLHHSYSRKAVEHSSHQKAAPRKVRSALRDRLPASQIHKH